ncbi:MAG: hypothetical protein ACI8UO_005741 [Verrucomicrobiales bacterium]|jgi:hypothetical protein
MQDFKPTQVEDSITKSVEQVRSAAIARDSGKLIQLESRLSDQILHDMTVDVRQAIIPALESVDQLLVIKA